MAVHNKHVNAKGMVDDKNNCVIVARHTLASGRAQIVDDALLDANEHNQTTINAKILGIMPVSAGCELPDLAKYVSAALQFDSFNVMSIKNDLALADKEPDGFTEDYAIPDLRRPTATRSTSGGSKAAMTYGALTT
jgi:hypothetical protein